MTDKYDPARKREKRRQSYNGTIEYLNQIPDVPMDVISGFVEAIRASTKVLQHHYKLFLDHEAEYKKFFPARNNEDSGNSDSEGPYIPGNLQGNSSCIHDQLMNRVQNAADLALAAKEIARQKRLEKQKLAIEGWIDSMKRFACQSSSNFSSRSAPVVYQQDRYQSPQKNRAQQPNHEERPSVPYACFLYLWDMQQEIANKLHVRRAALYLSGMILHKSKDCRLHLQMESNLADWIVRMTALPEPFRRASQQQEQQQSIFLALLQHEALCLLNKLQEQGYGRLYPKIAVAATRLRQRCLPLPTSIESQFQETETDETNSGGSNTCAIMHRNMVDWRKIRDLALKYGTTELRRLDRVVRKSQVALQILVPRMGQEFVSSTNAAIGVCQNDDSNMELSEAQLMEQQVNVNEGHEKKDTDTNGANASASAGDDDDEDEDDNIDWEDGDDEAELVQNERELMTNHPVHHLLAVDRTLAAMQSAAGGLLGAGGLEIDMRKSGREDQAEEPTNRNDSLEARRKVDATVTFAKLVKLLREKHLPRLNLWLDGLNNADNLVKSNAALILLPGDAIRQRQKLIRELTAIKKTVFSILASALQLEEKKKAVNPSSPMNEEEGNSYNDKNFPLMFGTLPQPLDTRRIQPMLASRGNDSGRSALNAAMARHKKRKRGARSGRIQIKVNAR